MFTVSRKHFDLNNANGSKFLVSREKFDLYTDIIFDKNTGDSIEYEKSHLKIGSKFTSFPNAFKTDNRLLGYSYSKSQGSQILTTNDIVNGFNTKAYAQWLQLINQTFDADGGHFSDSSTLKTLKFAPGYSFSEYSFPPNPTHSSKNFSGWYTGREGQGTNITEQSICPNSPTTYYAYWRQSLGTMVYCGSYDDGYSETSIELGEITSYDSSIREVTVKCNGSDYLNGYSETVTFSFEANEVWPGNGFQWEDHDTWSVNWYGVEEYWFDIYVRMKGIS